MLRPVYRLRLGDQVVDTTDAPRASTVVELVVCLDMDTPADRLTLVLARVGELRPEPGGEMVVELGWSGESPAQVMTGTVLAVETGLVHTRVVGHSAAEALLNTFADETFKAKTAGAMARDLAGRAGVGVARAEEGIHFPAYVVDGRRSVYHHLRDLAELSGFDLWLDSDGEMVFGAFSTGASNHGFAYGQDLVELDGREARSPVGTVEAWGESPADGGDASWAWLTKDFAGAMGSAGSGEPVLRLERPVLRTASAAATAAQAAHTALARRTHRGRLLTRGRPQVRLGDSIRLGGAPGGSPDGLYQVRSVTHRLDRRHGFTTTVGFRAVDPSFSFAG